jgi:hypothetical protein
MPKSLGIGPIMWPKFLIALFSFLSLHCDNGFWIVHVMSYMRYIWTKLKNKIFEKESQKGAINAKLKKKVIF